MDPIDQKLEALRERLLDLTRRNRLINYRTSKSRGIRIESVDALSLFSLVTGEARGFSFKHVPDEEDAVEAQRSSDARARLTDTAQHAQSTTSAGLWSTSEFSLQTPYSRDDLDKRLRNTARGADLFIQEQGANALYLGLAALKWFEDDASEVANIAPLILLPVQLKRSNVRGRYQMVLAGQEIQRNLSLAEKLRRDFGLTPFDAEDSEEGADFDFPSWLRRVKGELRAYPRWSIDDDFASVDIFAFSRLVMYRDLDPKRWPEGRTPSRHPIASALLGSGFEPDAGAVPHEGQIDELVAPENRNHVVDADSSQLAALEAAGRSDALVIQGPPGTGKSQTITNMIAAAVGNGQRVLFVAEKSAALAVVEANLEKAGIGDVALALHSHRSNKREFLRELERTAKLQRAAIGGTAQLQRLGELRSQLNDYADAVNRPVRESGLSPHMLHGMNLEAKAAMVGVESVPDLVSDELIDWHRDNWELAVPVLEDMETWCSGFGVPVEHPYWGSQLRAALPTTADRVAERASDALQALEALLSSARCLAEHIRLSPPRDEVDLARLMQAGALAASSPPSVEWLDASDQAWLADTSRVREGLDHAATVDWVRRRYDSELLAGAWTEPVEEIFRDLAQANGPLRFLSMRFRRARRAARDLFRGTPPKNEDEVLDVLEAIAKVQASEERIREHESELVQRLGTDWRRRDPDTLHHGLTTLTNAWRLVEAGELPETFITTLAEGVDREAVGGAVELVQERISDFEHARARVMEELKVASGDELSGGAEETSAETLDGQAARLKVWASSTTRLQEIVSLNHILDRLQDDGLEKPATAATVWKGAGQHLVSGFTAQWSERLLDVAYQERPVLAQFQSSIHERRIDKFRELDSVALEENRAKVRSAHRSRLPSPIASSSKFLAKQMRRRRGHPPIRKMLSEAGPTIQKIKPLFMMSPLSLAKFVPPGSVSFDLAIFDEASQIRPEDALGAILRADRVVVVGDSRQLPPTSFFDGTFGGDGADGSLLESVLDEFETQGATTAMLRWHYRSEHESLIAVSNERFYTPPGLFVFPSADDEDRGLRFHHLQDTVYGRGKNPREAQVVARAVMEHARTRSHESLGVGTFSQPQMLAIEDELERLRKLDPSLEWFFRDDAEEPFFVKNLETIQGDERDVVFISVGYGPDHDGRIHMQFGPVNQAGGERRLNVLFTRARRRCEVFSSLTASDIRPDGQTGVVPGLQILQAFLRYAETGELANDSLPVGGFQSPFEQQVFRRLVEHGLKVASQIGVAGYFIDLAVQDEERPGSYLLGIECDGAMYHSSRSARDRDRLRQDVLERRGWTIHRVWSTDWFRDPEGQVERILEAVERARVGRKPRRRPEPEPPSADIEDGPPPEPTPPPRDHAPLTRSRTSDRADLHTPEQVLLDAVADTLEGEGGPLAASEIVDRLLRQLRLVIDRHSLNQLLHRNSQGPPARFRRTDDHRWDLAQRGARAAGETSPRRHRASHEPESDAEFKLLGLPRHFHPDCIRTMARWSSDSGFLASNEKSFLQFIAKHIEAGEMPSGGHTSRLQRLYERSISQGFGGCS